VVTRRDPVERSRVTAKLGVCRLLRQRARWAAAGGCSDARESIGYARRWYADRRL